MGISKTEVAMAMPEWVAQIKDRKVLISVFALIIFHIMGRLPFNENGLKQEINEFDDLFGRFLSRDEILARINNNINSIEFVDEIKSESTCPAGQYIPEEKKVLIKKGY